MAGPDGYFSALEQVFEATASRHGGADSRACRVAGCPVRLRFASPALAEELTQALAHVRGTPGGAGALDIMIWDEGSAATPMPVPPWSWQDYMSRGEIGGLDPARYRAWYHVASGILNMIDLDRGRAVFWARDAARLPNYVVAAPFRMILQAWLGRQGAHFAHAAAVGTDWGGVLLAGAGGSGKSTTSLACLDAGMLFVSDDYCIVAAEPSPVAHSVYCSAKASEESLRRIPGLGPSRLDRPGPPDDKVLFLLHDRYAGLLAPQLRLRALLAPAVSDQEESSLEPVKALAAIRALAPSTMEQISGPDVSAWKMFTSLARQLPSFRLRLGRDVTSAPRLIERLVRELAGKQS